MQIGYLNLCVFCRYIVSDCDSLEVMVNGHKWLGDTGVDAAAQALKAG
jgi:beta-D-xylosidase 4